MEKEEAMEEISPKNSLDFIEKNQKKSQTQSMFGIFYVIFFSEGSFYEKK